MEKFIEQEKSLIILQLLTQLFGTVVLPSSKDKSEVFLPSPCQAILCRCCSYLQETTNTSDKWGEAGRVEIVFLSKVPLLQTVSQQFCCQLWVDVKLCKELVNQKFLEFFEMCVKFYRLAFSVTYILYM